MSSILLFDIDGTLVLTGGAGIRAMERTCQELFGIERALEGIACAGRTDWLILTDVLALRQVEITTDIRDVFRTRYCGYLEEEISRPGPRKGVMPGVRALLGTLAARDDVFLALLTGNFAPAARIKLEHFDLWRHFSCGAFGDDSPHRNDLVEVALQRARELGAPDVSPEHVFVVGDTPLDVACAAAAGVRAVAVATGTSSIDALRKAGADVVFEDLSEMEAFLQLLP